MTQEESVKKKVTVLATLKLNKGNMSKTARETGVARSTIRFWVSENKEAAALVEEAKARRVVEQKARQERQVAEDVDKVVALTGEQLEGLASDLFNQVKGLVATGNLRDTTWAFGVIYDKSRIAKDQPTSIHKMIGNLSDEEKAKRVSELLSKARQRRVNAGGQLMQLVPRNDNSE